MVISEKLRYKKKKKSKLFLHLSHFRDRCCEKHEESNCCPEQKWVPAQRRLFAGDREHEV